MASEAERLIGISLTKIAQSRQHRGGVSLHKNLLVATVLQKARYIFMEEAYNMVHYQQQQHQQQQHHQQLSQVQVPVQARNQPQEDLVGLTAEEAGLETPASQEDIQESSSGDFLQPQCVKCAENQDKENHPPGGNAELTYLDLDKTSSVLRERSNSPSLKRRRAVAEWETEEAVQSILPKRSRPQEGGDDGDDSVFLDDATLLSDAVSKEADAERPLESGAMEIDRITSLVSIFSFSMGDAKLNRSVSTPDLCSTQAKETPDGLQQRQFIAMAV